MTKRSKLTKRSILTRKSNVRKKIKFEKNVEFQIDPTPPIPPPILWILCLISAVPKSNYGKPKERRFDFGIETVVI